VLAQSREQPADPVAGQRDQLAIAWTAAAGLGGGQDRREGAGEQGQDGSPVPAGPAADLMLVQGGQLLPGSELVLIRHRDPATVTSWAKGTGRGA
jgi:hypothetical protein